MHLHLHAASAEDIAQALAELPRPHNPAAMPAAHWQSPPQSPGGPAHT